MITDQKQTAVPSATRGRMQLIKPVQTMNSGKVQSPLSSIKENVSNRTSVNYNPIKANTTSDTSQQQASNPFRAPSVAPTLSSTHTAITPEVDAQGYNSKYGYATGVKDPTTGEELFANPSYLGQGTTATPSYQDMVTELGEKFKQATTQEKLRFLNNVADGIYEANGMQTKATMTGDNYIANSSQDRYK